MVIRYPLATSTWDSSELQAMQEVISSGNFTMGEKVEHYEKAFSEHFNSKFGVMSNSGSSANLLAATAVRYSSFAPADGQDEVIVPAVSWSTTFFPLTQAGFRLKFVDIDLDTLNAPLENIASAIGSKTAGIMVVNLLGNPSQLQEIRELADAHSLFMIEDNCESLGAKYNGQFAGTFGDIGTFSSFFSHHISTMEGGVSVTDSLELAQVMTSLRAHGWTRELPHDNYVHAKSGDEFDDLFRFVLPGFNLRPLELEGAIGLEQVKKVDSIVLGRRQNADRFREVMADFPEFTIQKELGLSSWFGFSLVINNPKLGSRSELVQEMKRNGIAVRPIVAGNFTRNPVMKHLPHAPLTPFPNADKVHENGLFLGNHHYAMKREFELLHDTLVAFLNRAS